MDLNKELPNPVSPAKIYLKCEIEGRDLTTKVLKSSTYADESCFSTIEEKFRVEVESALTQTSGYAERLEREEEL